MIAIPMPIPGPKPTPVTRWIIATLLTATFAVNATRAAAAPALQMVDRVRSMSIAADGKAYDVTFAGHAAYYRVAVRTPAAKCLLRSMHDRQAVAVTGDAMTLIMDGCRPAAEVAE